LAFAAAIVLPAVIRALYAVTYNFAHAKRATAVYAGVAKYMGVAISIPEGDQVDAQDFGAKGRFVSDFMALGHRVPEIYIHDGCRLAASAVWAKIVLESKLFNLIQWKHYCNMEKSAMFTATQDYV
jgi:hypothetical protein